MIFVLCKKALFVLMRFCQVHSTSREYKFLIKFKEIKSKHNKLWIRSLWSMIIFFCKLLLQTTNENVNLNLNLPTARSNWSPGVLLHKSLSKVAQIFTHLKCSIAWNEQDDRSDTTEQPNWKFNMQLWQPYSILWHLPSCYNSTSSSSWWYKMLQGN